MLKSLRSQQHRCLIELLVDARRRAGLTQYDLAAQLGRPQSFVAKYENGERRLDVVEFVDLVLAMGGNPKRLFAKFLAAAKYYDG